jgi:deoxyhypusine synthase
MFVPNKNYIDFEEFFLPIVKKMERQIWKENKVFTSSMVITEMAKKIKNEESIYY